MIIGFLPQHHNDVGVKSIFAPDSDTQLRRSCFAGPKVRNSNTSMEFLTF